MQSVFLQKRHLETADASTPARFALPGRAGSAQRLYEPPLDSFGVDAVERWFTEKEISEIVKFTKQISVWR